MERDALTEGDLQIAVVKPSPTSRQTRYHCAIVIDLNETFDNVPHDGKSVRSSFLHDAQLTPWRWGLFCEGRIEPPENTDHADKDTSSAFFHRRLSLLLADDEVGWLPDEGSTSAL